MVLLSMIAAIGQGGQIGLDGRLPWHIPDDLRIFRHTTMGKTVVMGRKTFESIGRPLLGRKMIVLTSTTTDALKEYVTCVSSVQQAIAMAADEPELVVCGGQQVYEAFLPHVTRIYLSRTNYSGPADAHFPELDMSQWTASDERVYIDFVYTQLDRTKFTGRVRNECA